MAQTTTTQVDPAVATWYDRVLLTRAVPELTYERFAQVRNLARKHGNTIKFRRYTNLTPATTALTEGTTPSGSQLAKTDITATIAHYGDFVEITDVIDLTVEDAVLTETAELLGQQMGETRDALISAVLFAGASKTDAAGGANGNTPTEMTKADIDGVVQTLVGNNAKMFTPIIPGNTKVGTSPVRAAFWGIMHTDLLDDLEAVSSFKPVSEYPDSDVAVSGEWGSTGNVRWVVSSIAAKNTTPNPDEYSCMIIGRDAYAVTDIMGAASNIVKDFGSAGTADPLNQRATSGWKMSHVSKILNDNFMHSLEVTHS